LVLHSPGGRRSNYASTAAIENDDNQYPIDDLLESKECRLVTPVLGIPRIVAYGLARPFVEGTLFNSHPIPMGYAIVHVDRIKLGHRRSKLEYPGENGELKLGKNAGCHILWRKWDIKFGEEDSESSSSDSSPPQQRPLSPPPPQQQLVSSPPPQQQLVSSPPQQHTAPLPPPPKSALPPPPQKTAPPPPKIALPLKKTASHPKKTASQKKTTSSQSNRAQVSQKKTSSSPFNKLRAPLPCEKIDAELEAPTRLDVQKWMASLKKAPPPKKSAKELEAEAKMFGRAKKANVVKL
jgi:hypothetical protein